MKDLDEVLEIVNENGEVIGTALRTEIHGNPSLMHRVVHVLIFNEKGELLLQKRSNSKDVAPGKWDTSVGGHVEHGEDLSYAAGREMDEELGVRGFEPEHLYSYIHSNQFETELVNTYRCIFNGPFKFNIAEIDEIRFWDAGEIEKAMGSGLLSDNLEDEFRTYMRHQAPLASG